MRLQEFTSLRTIPSCIADMTVAYIYIGKDETGKRKQALWKL